MNGQLISKRLNEDRETSLPDRLLHVTDTGLKEPSPCFETAGLHGLRGSYSLIQIYCK